MFQFAKLDECIFNTFMKDSSVNLLVLRSSNFDFFDVIELVTSYMYTHSKKQQQQKNQTEHGKRSKHDMLTSWILNATFSRRYLNMEVLTSSSPIITWEKEMQVLLFTLCNTSYCFKYESMIC